MTRRPPRLAFTLFQLLALLALLAFLLGLLLPAVAKIREAAARAQSTNNLRQIALACHNYAATSNTFPEGCDKNHFSAFARLLPYVEQNPLYMTIDFTRPISDDKNKEARETVVTVFLDPRDAVASVTEGYAPTNYLFSAGSKVSLTDNDGICYMNSAVRLPGDIPDGTSNTVLAGATLKGNAKAKPGDLRRSHVALPKGDLKKLDDDSGVMEFKAGKHIAHDRGAAWIDGRFLKGTFTGTRRTNDPRPDVDCGGEGGLSGLRGLGNGALVAMCDGSARFVRDTTSAMTWRLLTCRNDGQVLPADFP